jgi:single-strand DNA-binding protein
MDITNYTTDMNTLYINRVELQGRVGTVRISPVHDTIVANFSVMTEHMYETFDGNKVVEATWMCVAAFEGDEVNLQSLTRGSIVHLTGRLRTNRYIDASGDERVFTEVMARSLKVLD